MVDYDGTIHTRQSKVVGNCLVSEQGKGHDFICLVHKGRWRCRIWFYCVAEYHRYEICHCSIYDRYDLTFVPWLCYKLPFMTQRKVDALASALKFGLYKAHMYLIWLISYHMYYLSIRYRDVQTTLYISQFIYFTFSIHDMLKQWTNNFRC